MDLAFVFVVIILIVGLQTREAIFQGGSHLFKRKRIDIFLIDLFQYISVLPTMNLGSSDSVQFVILTNCLHTVRPFGLVPMYQVLGKHLLKFLPNTWVNTLQNVNSQP